MRAASPCSLFDVCRCRNDQYGDCCHTQHVVHNGPGARRKWPLIGGETHHDELDALLVRNRTDHVWRAANRDDHLASPRTAETLRELLEAGVGIRHARLIRLL